MSQDLDTLSGVPSRTIWNRVAGLDDGNLSCLDPVTGPNHNESLFQFGLQDVFDRLGHPSGRFAGAHCDDSVDVIKVIGSAAHLQQVPIARHGFQ